MQRVILLTAAVACMGCISDEQYAKTYDGYRRQLRVNEENAKTIAALKIAKDKLEQEKKALQVEVRKRDEWLKTWSRRLEWAKHLPDAEISQEGNLILPEGVLYLPGSHELNPAGKARLIKVAEVLKAEAERVAEVLVEGHTDKTPIRKTKDKYDSNMYLSFMRAYSAYNMLIEKSGLDESMFSIAAYGEHKPRSNDAAENRRVEIRVLLKD